MQQQEALISQQKTGFDDDLPPEHETTVPDPFNLGEKHVLLDSATGGASEENLPKFLPDRDGDEIEKLTQLLGKLQLEEEALCRKKHLVDLKDQIAQKMESISKLMSSTDAKTPPVESVNPSAADPHPPLLNTKSLKKMAGKTADNVSAVCAVPLDNLLAALDNGPNSMETLLQAEMDDLQPSSVLPRPNLAWNIDAAQSNNVLTSSASAVNSLDPDGMANMLLKLKKSSGRTYFRVVDFLDTICQKDDERMLAEHGLTRLMINYGPRKVRLQDISIQ